jgi:hypothetical protein
MVKPAAIRIERGRFAGTSTRTNRGEATVQDKAAASQSGANGSEDKQPVALDDPIPFLL